VEAGQFADGLFADSLQPIEAEHGEEQKIPHTDHAGAVKRVCRAIRDAEKKQVRIEVRGRKQFGAFLFDDLRRHRMLRLGQSEDPPPSGQHVLRIIEALTKIAE